MVERHFTDWKEQMPRGGFNRAAAVPSIPLRTLPGKVPANYFARQLSTEISQELEEQKMLTRAALLFGGRR